MIYAFCSAMILFWVLVIAMLWGVVLFTNPHLMVFLARKPMILPALCIGPIFIFLGFSFFGVDLIFPSFLATSWGMRFWLSIVPAFVLFLASGLFVALNQKMLREYQLWSQKPFVLFATAMGKSPQKQVFRLVYSLVLQQAFLQCLPFIVSELLVVEVLFNAPGIGLDMWHQGKQFHLNSVAFYMVTLGGMYWLLQRLLLNWSQKTGRKLDSYA